MNATDFAACPLGGRRDDEVGSTRTPQGSQAVV